MMRPGDESGRGRLRASRADRELVIGTLKAAFVQGMLAKDEFEARVAEALVPRTYAELASLTADLPAELAGARPAQRQDGQRQDGQCQHGQRRHGQPSMRPSRLIAGATAAYAAIWLYELFLSPNGGDNPTFPPLIIGGFGLYVLVLLMAAAMTADIRANRPGSGPR